MAKLNQRRGTYTGLVADVIMSSWKGIDYLKHKGRRSIKPPSQKQLEQRAKIKTVSGFVYKMQPLLDMGFAPLAINKTGANAAFSYIYKNAISGEYPDYRIDPAKVMISRGDLPPAISPSVWMSGEDTLSFHWENNAGTGSAAPGDHCLLAVLEPSMNHCSFRKGETTRSSAGASINVKMYRGLQLHCWLAFVSANGKEVSDSVYLGVVDVPA